MHLRHLIVKWLSRHHKPYFVGEETGPVVGSRIVAGEELKHQDPL